MKILQKADAFAKILMTDSIKPEEKILIKILADLFNCRVLPVNMDADWESVFEAAAKHGVLSLLCDSLNDQNLSPALKEQLRVEVKATSAGNFRLFFLTRNLLNAFSEAGIPVVLIKGASVSRLYPVPEYRRSSDVDLLLLDESRLAEAEKLLAGIGMIQGSCEALHHESWSTPGGLELEFHTMLINPGKREDFNRCYREQLARLNGQYIVRDILGTRLPVLPDGYQAYELLLHMLHHFIREGFGLKLLCDWVAFWNSPVPEADISQFLSLVHEIHLDNFLRMITSVCHIYLDMSGNPEGIYAEDGNFVYCGGRFCDILPESETEPFLADILDGGEFGKANSDRLVTMNSSGLKGYISEFHYAMRRKFPRAGRCFLFWPVLWTATLAIFIRENRQNDRNGMSVIKKSSERSRMIEELGLFM